MNSSKSEVVTALWDRLQGALGGRYTLIGWLGAGAFGEVLHARQESTGQSVAVKVLRYGEHDAAGQRFLREMRACAALHHAHIVRVVDAGGDLERGVPLYTIFEYLPGETLARRLSAEGMLRVDQAITLASQILDALQTAHANRVVHRDLKPANIMVNDTALGLQSKVLDFGIAGFMDDAIDSHGVQLTLTGERLGTPAYCAPEQLRGEPTTARVDYFAWGLIFLECLTGTPVFGGSSLPEVLHAQFSKAPIPLPSILAEHALGRLLGWALEKDPSRRAGHAAPLMERLPHVDPREIVDDSGFLRLAISSGPTSGERRLITETVQPSRPRRERERRPATALCCRLAVVRAAPQIDDESLDEWLDDLHDVIAETAASYGGSLAGALGPESLFYFGLGPGDEASTRRAARAAIDIRDHCVRRSAVMKARFGCEVDVRLGVHPGIVTVHTDGLEPRAGLTFAAIVSARLCQRCQPGEIAASEAACTRMQSDIQVERMGGGEEEPWYRLSPIVAADAAAAPGATPTVGRASELTRLHAAWRAEAAERPRCILVTGVPGIGKTNLARTWCKALSLEGTQIFEAHCLPETQGTALYPILAWMRAHFGIAEEPPEKALDRLQTRLERLGIAVASAMPLLCAWLSLPGERWPDLGISPKKRRDLFLDLMVKCLSGAAEGRVILWIEDLHWADPTTLEWLMRV